MVGRWGPGPLRARIRQWLLPRCKRQMQDAQHKKATQGGRERGGGNKTKPNRRPTETATEQETQKPETGKQKPTKHRTNKPFGLTEEETPNRKSRNTGKTRGERPRRVQEVDVEEKNASEMIVKSSVVPKQKPGKQKNTEKTASNSSRRSQSTAEKEQVASQPALPPRKQKERDKKRT